MAEQDVAGPEAGAKAGLVAVVQQDHAAGVAAEERGLVVGERGAERRDHVFDAGEHEPEHVEVALHHEGPALAPDRLLRLVQVVERGALVEDLGLGGVQVLRLPLAEDPAPERHHPPAQVVDREEEPAPEPGHQGAVLPADEQPRVPQRVIGDAEPPHRLVEAGAARGEAEPEVGRDLEVQPAPGQVGARRLRVGGLEEPAGEPVVRRRRRGEERLARVGAGVPVGPLRDHDPRPARRVPHGGGIVHPEALHEVGERVARLVADVAVEEPLLRDHGEVAVLPAMERAGAAPVGPGALEVHRLAHQADEVHRVADLLDHVVGDPAHARNSSTVTPLPPWLAGAKPKRATRRSRRTSSCTRARTTPVPFPWMTRRKGWSASTARSIAASTSRPS